MPIATLVTVPGVELLQVGDWDASSGRFQVTPDMLTAAVEAVDNGTVPAPVIKIGHTDPRFEPGDGEPALGYVANLRVTPDGNTLVGDYTGVPQYLADIMASAYPTRSIEGRLDVTLGNGVELPFYLTAVALLGATAPAVTPLRHIADIRDLYGVAASTGAGKSVSLTAPATNTPTTAMAVALAAARRTRRARGK